MGVYFRETNLLLCFKRSRFLRIIGGLVFIGMCAFSPLMMQPGLLQAEAISPFLNGSFPEEVPSGDIKLEPAFPNITFNSPLTWAVHPHDEKIFVGQRDGKVFYFDDDENTTVKTSFMDLSSQVGVVWDGGFLGFTFHPNFGLPGAQGRNYFFVYYSTKDQNGRNSSPTPQLCPEDALYDGAYLVLQRYEVFDGTLNVDFSKTIDMIKVRLYNSTHRGGGLIFGTDGFLYLTTGDQAQHSTAQTMDNNLDGGVLRLDVNMDPTKSHAPTYLMPKDLPRAPDETSGNGYFIPDDNPFVGQTNVFEEYYTLGHRNPHRMTMDRQTGIMYIGEIGSNKHEEINIVKKGKNYGWPVWEGAQAHNRCTNQLYPGTQHELPLTAFPRSVANSITGGYVYRGLNIPELEGKYICGDYGSADEIWSVDINTGAYTLLLNSNNPISFGEDKRGELYVLRQGNNLQLQKLVKEGANFDPPLKLSETNAFTNLNTLSPAQGILPYDMYESFWSDGAIKKRWLAIPNDGDHNSPAEQINYQENEDWEFPVGSVFIKHFEMPIDESNPGLTQRLETRFTVVSNSGKVYGLTYKWRADGSDADLLTTSFEENITIQTSSGPRTQSWYYPSRSDCLSCHNEAVNGVLGLRTRYINQDMTYPSTGINANQLVTLSSLGIIPDNITDANVASLPSNASQNQDGASLEKRARSYLDLNCGYCHRPGTGNRAVFDARINTSLYLSGLFSDQLNQSLGINGEKIIFPGDTAKSVLYQRIHSIDPSIMMPPLAKGEIDENGADLIAEWIQSLDPATTVSCTPINVGLNKSATQSSLYPSTLSFEAGNALDGNNNGDDGGNSITHTLREANAWWEVDLGAVYAVSYIKLWNRSDCCADRLSNFYILSSEAPFTSQDLNTSLNQTGVKSVYYSGVAGRETDLSINAEARYIRIQLAGTNFLTLAEVEIMGCVIPGSGPSNGLTANYFNNNNFTSPALQRIDPVVDFNWGTGSPAANMDANTFSIRWEGGLLAPTTGSYTIYTNTDDGVRLWINNQFVIDKWIPQAPTEWSATVNLPGDQLVPIRMEYYEQGGGAVAQLRWEGPGITKSIIPQNNLYPLGVPYSPLPPDAIFTATPNSGQAELLVNFDGSNSSDPDGSIASFVWDLGDGTTGEGSSISHTYQDPGTYIAQLIVTDQVGNKDTATQTIEVLPRGLAFRLKMVLEGAYQSGSGLMIDQLRNLGALSATDPYGLNTNMDQALLSISGDNAIVDWVFVELRDAANPTSLVTRKAFLLQRDGDLMTPDGRDTLFFDGIQPGNYYIVVGHNNHLGMASLNAVDLSSMALVDFSDPATDVWGGNDSGVIRDAMRMCVPGDANGDGTVNATDKNQYWRAENGQSYTYGVTKADFNLDGVVNALDKNQYWRQNNSKVAQLP